MFKNHYLPLDPHIYHMLLGVVGPLVVGVVTYGLKTLSSCAISTVVSALCQALRVQLSMTLQWPRRW